MIPNALSYSFLVEQLEVLREIGRNIATQAGAPQGEWQTATAPRLATAGTADLTAEFPGKTAAPPSRGSSVPSEGARTPQGQWRVATAADAAAIRADDLTVELPDTPTDIPSRRTVSSVLLEGLRAPSSTSGSASRDIALARFFAAIDPPGAGDGERRTAPSSAVATTGLGTGMDYGEMPALDTSSARLALGDGVEGAPANVPENRWPLPASTSQPSIASPDGSEATANRKTADSPLPERFGQASHAPARTLSAQNSATALTRMDAGSTQTPFSSTSSVESSGPRATAIASDAAWERLTARVIEEQGLAAFVIRPEATLPERAGVIASFVLNAHFLPGWPPAWPIESISGKEFVRQLARDGELSGNDIELLTYLANFGFNRQQLERILKALSKSVRKTGFLEALASLVTSLSVIVQSVKTELETVIDELVSEQGTTTRPAPGGRRHIVLG